MFGFNDFKKSIIFEDENYYLINKPPYVSSLNERIDRNAPAIVEFAKSYCSSSILCHRIDKETSGILLIAKNETNYRHFSIQFEKRIIHKKYHAITNSKVNIENLVVDLPLITDNKRKVFVQKREGKISKTIFNTLKQYQHFTLLECEPVTGRLHQIRVHAASQNFPLVGDELYGGKPAFLNQIKKNVNFSKDEEAKPILSRVALHAFSIILTDMSGSLKEYIAGYPKDLQTFVKILEKYDNLK